MNRIIRVTTLSFRELIQWFDHVADYTSQLVSLLTSAATTFDASILQSIHWTKAENFEAKIGKLLLRELLITFDFLAAKTTNPKLCEQS